MALFSSLISPFSALKLNAQAPPSKSEAANQRKGIRQYVHTVWNSTSGFAADHITAITQTTDGYLWLGTTEGLVRLDGAHVTTFDRTNTKAMTNDAVHVLATAQDGSLWIGTADGLLHWKDGIFTRYTERDGIPGNNILTLETEQDGTLLIGATRGLDDFRQRAGHWKDGKFTVSDPFFSRNRQCFGQSALRDHDGNLWMTHLVGGLTILRNGKQTTYTAKDGLPNGTVELLLEDRSGTVWIQTAGGLSRFKDGKINTYRLRPGGAEPKVNCLLEDEKGDVWMGTRGDGLFRWTTDGVESYSMQDGLSNSSVGEIYEDREHNIWIVTATGLDLLQDALFTTYGTLEGLSDEHALAITETRDGSILIGSLTGTLNALKDGHMTVYNVPKLPPRDSRDANGYVANAIFSLYQNANGNIFASRMNGLNQLMNGKLVSMRTAPATTTGLIEAIYQDSSGALWLGAEHGLFRLKDDKYTAYVTSPGSAINAVSVIVGSSDGGLWVGTSGGGLRHFKDGFFKTYTSQDGLSHDLITSLYQGADGTLWIGTPRGLDSLKDGRIKIYTDKDHMLTSQVCSILEDNDGYLWLSSNRGIIRIAVAELAGFSSGKINTLDPMRYGVENGMRSAACAEGTQPTGWKDHRGDLWFATGRGIVEVNPDQVYRAAPLLVHVETVKADLLPVDPIHGGNLPPGKNNLEISYSAPTFQAPNRVQFRYKLAGFDQDWVAAGTRRYAYYTNIPPGKYQFQVQVKNLNGKWNEAAASVDLYLMPHFYQTLWFRVGCFISVVFLLWGGYLLRERHLITLMRLRLEERLADRTRIAQDLHDTFLQNVVGLVLHVEMAANQLPSDPLVAKQTLQRVLDQLRQTATGGRQALTDLRRPNISSSDLARALSQVGDELRGESDPALQVKAEGDVIWLHPLIGDEIFQIGREALLNAFRHSRAKTVHLILTCTADELQFQIADDGVGIPLEVLSSGLPGHFGLQGMRERVNRIGGQLGFRNRSSGGTEVTVRVPLRDNGDRTRSQRSRWSPAHWLRRLVSAKIEDRDFLG
jgi:ligand-binding sensor domain-containing protein/signal transduction histidine kinase